MSEIKAMPLKTINLSAQSLIPTARAQPCVKGYFWFEKLSPIATGCISDRHSQFTIELPLFSGYSPEPF